MRLLCLPELALQIIEVNSILFRNLDAVRAYSEFPRRGSTPKPKVEFKLGGFYCAKEQELTLAVITFR